VAALIGHAQTVIVVTEHAKLGKVTFARICDIERVDELVTDGNGNEAELAAIAAAGVHITLV
jgi:DeoR family transcriptional regulator of aga operon